MATLKFTIRELDGFLGTFRHAIENLDEEELLSYAAGVFYFNYGGWQHSWPLHFILNLSENVQIEADIFILGMDGSKPLFHVV